jgi:deoxyribodipyrimidine photo-lyase
MTSILWFRRDLRLADNPALDAALARGTGVVCVYIHDDEDAGVWRQGGASRWWLAQSLAALGENLATRGNRLILRRGRAEDEIAKLIDDTGADTVMWNRRYEPWAVKRDERIKTALKARGIAAQSFNASLLAEPWSLKTQKGDPYRVFTPFRRALYASGDPARPTGAPAVIRAPRTFPNSDNLADWKLPPTKPDWAGGLRESWIPGEAGAHRNLGGFMDGAMFGYRDGRDRPGIPGTSRLSAHLHFGEIGPRQIWHAVTARSIAETASPRTQGVETFLSEIAWREFSHHLLYHFPTLPEAPLRPEFTEFPWRNDINALRAWQRGRTGYPIVDAGMRELWTTGWMHNRVRMIVASFLIKDLLLPWRAGEDWFWDTLVDADLANNAASWQWVAGCGADAAPYFRVFNPTLQGEKFDPDGRYVRRWVPEIAALPDKLIHAPWKATPLDLAEAGIRVGHTYPIPIVDHAGARLRALDAYRTMRAE